MSPKSYWPWQELGLDGPTDFSTVRRAYARRLKEIDQEDPHPFQNLLAAFEAAKQQSKPRTKSKPKPAIAALIDQKRNGTSLGAASLNVVHYPPPARPASPPAGTAETADTGPGQNDTPEVGNAKAHADSESPYNQNTTTPPNLNAWRTTRPEGDRFEWLERFKEALSYPWDTDRLNELLSMEMARGNMDLRSQAEHMLFHDLADRKADIAHGFYRSMALFLDENFDWSADGVRLIRRFGNHRDFNLVVEAHALSFKRPRPVSINAERERVLALYILSKFSIIMILRVQTEGAVGFLSLLIEATTIYVGNILLLQFAIAILSRISFVSYLMKHLSILFAPKLTQMVLDEPQSRTFFVLVFPPALFAFSLFINVIFS